MGELTEVEQEQESLDRAIAAAPDEESLKGVAETTSFSIGRRGGRRRQDSTLARRGKKSGSSRKGNSGPARQAPGKCTRADIESDDAARMVKLAARTRETMQRISPPRDGRQNPSPVDAHYRIVPLSSCARCTMVEQIHIDPETFAVTIFDDAGLAIAKRRLSEGEKQIFAIAVLWGLGRASARSLPAIIDTPMARLDVKHRNHLVQRYFPNASHQVIILSTDTEVDRRYYDELAPYIARAYHLSYDETEKRTVAEEGYFWSTEAAGIAAGSQEDRE